MIEGPFRPQDIPNQIAKRHSHVAEKLFHGQTALPQVSIHKALPEVPPVLIMHELSRQLQPGTPTFPVHCANLRKIITDALTNKQITPDIYESQLRGLRSNEREHLLLTGGKDVIFFAKNLLKVLPLPSAVTKMPVQENGPIKWKSLCLAITNILFGSSGKKEFESHLQAAYDLANPSEQIGNKFKNLIDYVDLKPGVLDTVEDVADSLIEDLRKAKDLDPPMSEFRGKKVAGKDNRGALETLLVLAEERREALLDVIAAKQAKASNVIHFCMPIQMSLQFMRTPEQANQVGKFLMSEVCNTGGGRIELNLKRYQMLKNDPRVQQNPMLLKAVLKAGHEVQIEAMRRLQTSLVQDLIRKLDPQGWKDTVFAIDAIPPNSCHDLQSLVKHLCKNTTAFTEDALMQKIQEARTGKDGADYLRLEKQLVNIELSLVHTK